MWVPVIICTHWFFCTGQPIKGDPLSSREECEQVQRLAKSLYADPVFESKYVVRTCEKH